MVFKVAIASGKGGTGKTTVALNLYQELAQNGVKTILVDCDVEEPNAGLFLARKKELSLESVYQLIPQIDEKKCLLCGRCQEWCEFNAIIIIPSKRFAKVDPDLCHSCGACLHACNDHAIKETSSEIGQVFTYQTNVGKGLYEGRLKVGSSMQTMMIKELKKRIPSQADVIIYDSPPGTSCQVVETISDTDYVVLVTEPTPFGLHDLKLMVTLMKQMDKAFGVVVNKVGLGDDKLFRYLEEEKIPILCEIPFDKSFASSYAKGDFLNSPPLRIQESVRRLVDGIENVITCLK